jgi:hypothetical protein
MNERIANSKIPVDDTQMSDAMRHAMAQMDGARSVVVNRTHRVVREQAMAMQAQKRERRDLMVPILIVSVMLSVICYAIWKVFDASELTPNGVPDASDQLIVLLLWSLPVTALVLGLVWFKRGRARMNNGEVRR